MEMEENVQRPTPNAQRPTEELAVTKTLAVKEIEALRTRLRSLELEPCKQCSEMKKELLKLRHKKGLSVQPESSVMKVLRKWYPDIFSGRTAAHSLIKEQPAAESLEEPGATP